MIKRFIAWMVNRSPWDETHPLTDWGTKTKVAWRYAPFWPDEIQRGNNTIWRKLPWYRPFNILLHNWHTSDDGNNLHDHPRWSITIVLRGQLTEITPWRERVLRPGNVVFRRAKYIHGFRVEKEHSNRTWTLFIVGRRKRPQNTYVVTRVTEASIKE